MAESPLQGEGHTLVEALRMLEHESEARENRCAEVHLNVYDLLEANSYVYRLGLGAFHSGVEVHGTEYAYGAHPYSFTGIYDMEPRQADRIAGGQVRFREAIHLGHTHLSFEEVKELAVSLGRDYNGCDYSVLHRNCNHFTSDFCQRLCGVTPPRWVNRLARIASWMPQSVINSLPSQLFSSPSSITSLHTPAANPTDPNPDDM